MEKNCFKCGLTKPLEEFYAHPMMADGRLGKCKTCTKRDVAKRETRLRESNPQWLRKERARCREKQDRRRAMGLASPMKKEYGKKWSVNNRPKRRAQDAAGRAQKTGMINKPPACEECGSGGRLEKHHDDYSKPLDVRWLCSKCHGITRRKDL